jgi:hypothetical protein
LIGAQYCSAQKAGALPSYAACVLGQGQPPAERTELLLGPWRMQDACSILRENAERKGRLRDDFLLGSLRQQLPSSHPLPTPLILLAKNM